MINKGVKEEATTPKGITALSEMYGPAITRDFPEIMIHQPLIGGGGLQGQATEIKIHADHLVRTREKLNKFLSDRTGIGLDVIEKDTERDNYMTAEEALEYGLIDGIMTKRA